MKMQQQTRHSGLELREGIFDNVPHIIIGKDKPQAQQPPAKPPLPPQQSTYPQPIRPEPPKDLIDKLRNYALIFFTCLILGSVGYIVLKIILGRFF